jgi:hypothetical protein
MLGVMDGFDDKPVVSRKVEEGPGFAGRSQFGENIFGGQR